MEVNNYLAKIMYSNIDQRGFSIKIVLFIYILIILFVFHKKGEVQ